MDPANMKNHANGHGPWGPLDRTVYHYPFGGYVYRSVSGYGQEGSTGYGFGALAMTFLLGLSIGTTFGGQLERRTR